MKAVMNAFTLLGIFKKIISDLFDEIVCNIVMLGAL